jgi:scyllo-inositol 2-dehydrogenase (NADP+)
MGCLLWLLFLSVLRSIWMNNEGHRMVDKVKVGIAGLGRSGWGNHAEAFERLKDKFEVAAAFDPLGDRRQQAVERFGCKAYADFDSLIHDSDIELVVVATPSYLHATQSIKALKAAKGVVCEKPMAMNLAEADNMIKTAKETGSLLTVFQNRRYENDFQKVMEIIHSGKLGRVFLIKICNHSFGRRWDWQTLRRFGGGELLNNGPHVIDQALQLLGPATPKIFCDMQRTLTLGDAEDHIKIVLKAPDSPIVDLELTRGCAYPRDRWLVMGTQGGLVGTTSSLMWKYFNSDELPRREVETEPTPNRSYNWEEIPWKEEVWEGEAEYIKLVMAFYEDLYETLRHGKPLRITPESARRVMWLIEQCTKQVD